MIPQLSQTVKKIRTSKREIVFQILIVFIIPVLLLQTGVLPLSTRIPILVAIVTFFVLLLLKEKWTLGMLHVETKNFKKFLFPYLLFTLVGIVIISSLGEKIGNEELARWWSRPHFLYLFMIVSIFQEIAYRGYLVPALRKLVESPVLIIFFNALIFTYMHSIFPNPQIGLPLAFVGGLGFAAMYIRYPNLPLIILSHAALNFTAVLYGFFFIH